MRLHVNKGFTLIELMIAVSLIGITVTWLVQAQINAISLSESETALQRANRALRNQVEILRAMSPESMAELVPGQAVPFDSRVKELENLVAGRGVISIEEDPDFPDLLVLNVKIYWRDPRGGIRSIHTELLESKALW
ncbi:type II secretion system protein [Desulfobacterales bacterium HSG16]|nr:type II secretion system protein [Desulfobacterales bacterium HSG16]